MKILADTLRKAQQGDVVALGQVISEFASPIHEECSRFGLWQLPDWSHSDLNQEVVIRVLEKLKLFKGIESENLRAVFEQWIRVTSRNVVKNLLRDKTTSAKKPEKPVQAMDDLSETIFAGGKQDKTASSIWIQDEQAAIVQAAIAECLDEESATILSLRVVEGLSLRQISERLPLTYDQVRYKFNQSLTVLKKKIGEKL